MTEKDNNNRLGELSQTAKEYANLRLDEYKLKGVENFSLLSNKILVILVATMLGAVILQLLGFALAFFIGDITGSTSIGFAAMAVLFGCVLGIIWFKRNTLFTNRMIRMYVKMFFGNNTREQQ